MQVGKTRGSNRRNRFLFFPILMLFLCLPKALLAQTSQEKEARAEAYLSQADELYSSGNYSKAIDNYLQAAQIAGRKMNLSRAYMGLSLCYFYTDDTENSKKYILKALELDPQKEVSSLFHPQTYVDLFDQVKKENADKLSLIKIEPEAEAAQEEAEKAEPQAAVAPGLAPEEGKAGRWEVEFHFSGWSLNPAETLLQENLADRVSDDILEDVTDQLNAHYAGRLVPAGSENNLALSSSGSNYGLGVRYYPQGKQGSFSVGFYLEKTNITISMEGAVTQYYADGSEATVDGTSTVTTNPLTGNLNFQWIVNPRWRVTPYFVFGLGFGPFDGDYSFTYTGTYRRGPNQVTVEGEDSKTLDQLREEEEIELDLFLLLQAAIGVKGEIYKNIFVLGEIGFWDGLVFRGGVSYRF